jgi:hypothetical protein
MDNIITNRVTESLLTTVDLEIFLPKEEIAAFDLKPFLFMELILKEKDFREKLKEFDWTIYQNKQVAVFCSADAIIPVWAYMLIATYLTPIAARVQFGTVEQVFQQQFLQNIADINTAEYTDKRVVVKGCGNDDIKENAYLAITHKLQPVVKSIMYGEPCSTVPIYKKKS